jgi:dihydroorotate dehydrogenase electron transfer subunit
MKCGLGLCDACALGPWHVCVDGPVFPGEVLTGAAGFSEYFRDASGRRRPWAGATVRDLGAAAAGPP